MGETHAQALRELKADLRGNAISHMKALSGGRALKVAYSRSIGPAKSSGGTDITAKH
jgi:hypothetical protein